MDARRAAEHLEVIRTLMERTCRYQFLTARAGLAAGVLASLGSLSFVLLEASSPYHFGIVWGAVFLGSLLTTVLCTVLRSRERGESIWSRQARAVVAALAPSVFAALVCTIFFFSRGGDFHLWLPGIWMLCYGQGALATAAYAPAAIRRLGLAVLFVCAPVTFVVGPQWAVLMMGLTFGLGHGWLGLTLLIAERREAATLRPYRTVA